MQKPMPKECIYARTDDISSYFLVGTFDKHTLFMATIAFVAPFIPVEIDVLAYNACQYWQ